MLQKFDCPILNYCAAHRSFVHNRGLCACIDILNCDCLVDRVVVVVNFHSAGINFEVRSLIFDPLLHLKAIWVRIKDILVVNVIEVPLGDHFTAFVVDQRDLIHLNLKFNRIASLSQADQDLIDKELLGIAVYKRELRRKRAMERLDLVECGVRVRFLIIELRHK